jgi:hypothetical protein
LAQGGTADLSDPVGTVTGMAHARRYSDGDPYLADVRRVCLALPETAEVEAWGRPTFRVGKVFAVFSGTEEHPFGVVFRPEEEERVPLTADRRFYSPPYWGPGGWLALDLSAAEVDWQEVAELVESSYRLVAPKRLVTALDARASSA